MELIKSIAFDADDTIIYTLEMLNDFYNAKYNKKFSIEDYTSYDLYKIWGVSCEQTVEDIRMFYDSEFYGKIKTTTGAHEAVSYLSKKYDLHIVTSRSKDAEEYLNFTLSKLFLPDHFLDIHSIGYGPDSSMCKWEKCKEINTPILIDDHHGHLISAAEQGMHGILIPAPWNKNITDLPKEIFRVRNLSEAVEVIEKNQKIIWK